MNGKALAPRNEERMAQTAPDTRPTEPALLRADARHVATLSLNRPRASNSLNRELVAALASELRSIAGDPAVRVVIIDAVGEVFCAGHDMRELLAERTRANYEETFRQSSNVMKAIAALPQPVIAKVQGTATAAGCQLVATCDLAFAADTARFATPGVDIGLFCSTPMVALSRNVGRKQAMALLLTGEPVDAATAERIGLINKAVPAPDLDAATAALAERIAGKPPAVIKLGKEAFHKQIEMGLAEAYDYASEVMALNMLGEDAAEGIAAFLEKRPAKWRDG